MYLPQYLQHLSEQAACNRQFTAHSARKGQSNPSVTHAFNSSRLFKVLLIFQPYKCPLQTDLNRLKLCQGRRLNPLLNRKGREQAHRLLPDTSLGAILCSPLRRARETAGIVRER